MLYLSHRCVHKYQLLCVCVLLVLSVWQVTADLHKYLQVLLVARLPGLARSFC